MLDTFGRHSGIIGPLRWAIPTRTWGCAGGAVEVSMAARRAPGAVAKGPHDVVEAATTCYLRGEPLDMSALAAQLGIGRATLYRWVGNREELLARVIAETSERTFRA